MRTFPPTADSRNQLINDVIDRLVAVELRVSAVAPGAVQREAVLELVVLQGARVVAVVAGVVATVFTVRPRSPSVVRYDCFL